MAFSSIARQTHGNVDDTTPEKAFASMGGVSRRAVILKNHSADDLWVTFSNDFDNAPTIDGTHNFARVLSGAAISVEAGHSVAVWLLASDNSCDFSAVEVS